MNKGEKVALDKEIAFANKIKNGFRLEVIETHKSKIRYIFCFKPIPS